MQDDFLGQCMIKLGGIILDGSDTWVTLRVRLLGPHVCFSSAYDIALDHSREKEIVGPLRESCCFSFQLPALKDPRNAPDQVEVEYQNHPHPLPQLFPLEQDSPRCVMLPLPSSDLELKKLPGSIHYRREDAFWGQKGHQEKASVFLS